jgi:hypothetical protein
MIFLIILADSYQYNNNDMKILLSFMVFGTMVMMAVAVYNSIHTGPIDAEDADNWRFGC